ncbi:MAG: hypothetical protein ACXWUS_19930 [Burkholderiales bacterium]
MSRFLAFLLLTLLYSRHAYAYIDPGSTMLLLQGLLAALGAVLMFVRNPIKTVKSLLAKLLARAPKS